MGTPLLPKAKDREKKERRRETPSRRATPHTRLLHDLASCFFLFFPLSLLHTDPVANGPARPSRYAKKRDHRNHQSRSTYARVYLTWFYFLHFFSACELERVSRIGRLVKSSFQSVPWRVGKGATDYRPLPSGASNFWATATSDWRRSLAFLIYRILGFLLSYSWYMVHCQYETRILIFLTMYGWWKEEDIDKTMYIRGWWGKDNGERTMKRGWWEGDDKRRR